MKTLLLLDTETSGLDPAKDQLLEVGMVLWSVEHRTTLASSAWLVYATSNAAEDINAIPPAALIVAGRDRVLALGDVKQWASQADAIVAHNAEFDRQWVGDLGKPWVDGAWDLAWPKASSDRKLHSLCLAHGLAVLDAHRALPDCQLLARLFERVAELGHDVGAMLERAMRPKSKIVSLAPFEQKDVVKAAGFRWDPQGKVWWRNMAAEDVPALPFRTRRVGP